MAEYREVVAEMIEPLFRAYPSADNPKGKGKRLAVYVDALVNLPDDLLQRAVMDLLKTSRFMPTVQEIYSAAIRLAPDKSQREKWPGMIQELEELRHRAAAGEHDPLAWEWLATRFEESGAYYLAVNTRRLAGEYAELARCRWAEAQHA